MKKRILVTGANGFIGQNFIKRFGHKSYEISALDYQPELVVDSSKVNEYFSINIRKPFQLDSNFDVVIHLAALNRTHNVGNLTYDQFKAVNVTGTENVANSCNFKKFIFFSTAKLYQTTSRQIKEDSPVEPTSFYQRSKYEAELACKEEIENKKLIILRPTNITGINQKSKSIVPVFFSQALNNKPIEIFVPKNKKIQLLSVNDVLRALKIIISNDHIHGIFNLSNEDKIEIKKLAEKIIKLCDSNSVIKCTSNNLEEYSEISCTKVKQLLNWQPQETIDQIISSYAQLFKLEKDLSSWKKAEVNL